MYLKVISGLQPSTIVGFGPCTKGQLHSCAGMQRLVFRFSRWYRGLSRWSEGAYGLLGGYPHRMRSVVSWRMGASKGDGMAAHRWTESIAAAAVRASRTFVVFASVVR